MKDETKPTPQPQATPRKRGPRRVTKKATFKRPPRGPWPIRALWEGTTEEDRHRAHTRCIAILEYWLGKATKTEIAQRLELPPLRIWQLSQQALAGMLASLVHQPRWKEARGIMTSRPRKATDVKALQRRIKELEHENAALLRINALLRDFPPPPPTPKSAGKKKAKPTTPPRRAPTSDRGVAPDTPT